MADDPDEMRQTLDHLISQAKVLKYDTLAYILGMALLELSDIQDAAPATNKVTTDASASTKAGR